MHFNQIKCTVCWRPLESNPPFKFLAIKYPTPPPPSSKKQSRIKHTGAIWCAIFQNLTPKYQRVGRRPALRNRLNLSAPSAAESRAAARLNNISGNWRRIKENPPATEASASPYISFISSRRRTEKSQQEKKATKSHLHVNDNTGRWQDQRFMMKSARNIVGPEPNKSYRGLAEWNSVM